MDRPCSTGCGRQAERRAERCDPCQKVMNRRTTWGSRTGVVCAPPPEPPAPRIPSAYRPPDAAPVEPPEPEPLEVVVPPAATALLDPGPRLCTNCRELPIRKDNESGVCRPCRLQLRITDPDRLRRRAPAA